MTHSQYLEELYKVSTKHSQITLFLAHTAGKENFLCVSKGASSQHMHCFWVLLKYRFLNSTERSVTVDYFTVFRYWFRGFQVFPVVLS